MLNDPLSEGYGDAIDKTFAPDAGDVSFRDTKWTGAWTPAAPYWDNIRRSLSDQLKDALGKLAPNDVDRQLGGNLDTARAMSWERGNMRIWEKHLPDRTLEAGMHVIISIDNSGSMQANDIGCGIQSQDAFNQERAPPGMPVPNSTSVGSWIRANGRWIPATDTTPNEDVGRGYIESWNNGTVQGVTGYTISRVHAVNLICPEFRLD